MNKPHLTDIRFENFQLAPSLLNALGEQGYQYCTAIQSQSIPLGLSGKDLIGQAQTGMGKTAAFLTIAINRLLNEPEKKGKQPRVIVLAPTRELVTQIQKEADGLVVHTDLIVAAAYGGVDYEKQRKRLADGVDILIATPGRVIDYFKQGVFNFRQIDLLVLDEADRMLDLGFLKDIRYLVRKMPPLGERQALLFSATLSYRVTELAYEFMNNPEMVRTEAEKTDPKRIGQRVYFVSNDEKIPLLLTLIQQDEVQRAIVFCNTKRDAEKVTAFLLGNDVHAELLSGDVPQRKRQRLIGEFEEGKFPILVATDVAARGLHINDVSHVFNYDLPNEAEDYVHRIGRTGRFGSQGQAISFACESSAFYLPDIEQYIEHQLERATVSSDQLIKPKPPKKMPRNSKPPQGNRGNSNNKKSSAHKNRPRKPRPKPAG